MKWEHDDREVREIQPDEGRPGEILDGGLVIDLVDLQERTQTRSFWPIVGPGFFFLLAVASYFLFREMWLAAIALCFAVAWIIKAAINRA